MRIVKAKLNTKYTPDLHINTLTTKCKTLEVWQGIGAQFGGVAGDWRSIWGRGERATTQNKSKQNKHHLEFQDHPVTIWKKQEQELPLTKRNTMKKQKETNETNARFVAYAKEKAPWLVSRFFLDENAVMLIAEITINFVNKLVS